MDTRAWGATVHGVVYELDMTEATWHTHSIIQLYHLTDECLQETK